MEDRKLPWWRRALNLALDGIRTGFGLFSKPHKDDSEHEPEIAAAQDGFAEEDARGKLDSARVEAVAESVAAEGPAQVAEAAAEPVSEVVAEPVVEAAEEEPIAESIAEHVAEIEVEAATEASAESVSEPVDEVIEEPLAELAAEPVDEMVEKLVAEPVRDEVRAESLPEESALECDEIPQAEIVENAIGEEAGRLNVEQPESIPEMPADLKAEEEEVGPEAAVTTAPAEAAEAVATSVPPTFAEVFESALKTAPETVAFEDVAQDAEVLEDEPSAEIEVPVAEADAESEPVAEVEIGEDAIGEAVIEEPSVETAPEGHVNEIVVVTELPEEAGAEPESVPDVEPGVALPEVAETAAGDAEESAPQTLEQAEVAAEAAVEVVAQPAPEAETPAESAEQDKPAHGVYTATEVEPAEEIAGPVAKPEAEIEPPTETAGDEEPAPAEDSISDEAVSSVELSKPVPAEVAEETPGQTESIEIESLHEEGPSAAEPVPQDEELEERTAEHDAEQVAEESPEPADIPMELNEVIPKQTGPGQPANEQAEAPAESNEPLPVEEAVAAAEPVESLATTESGEVEATEAVEAAESVETSGQTAVAAMVAAEAAAEVADEAGPTAAATPAPPAKPFIKLESRDNESDLSPFSVVVSQVYDGPLDLLLDLIRKQDIDIYDIPIARITAQFLAYVNQLKGTDVDVAGEFIYTASLLIHIKSKMLLPRAPSGGDDAAEDPRRELVERLLEHERFKNAAQMLQQKQMLEAATWTNPGLREFQDDTSAEPEIAADTVDLVRIFRDILERARNRPVINVQEDSVTVGQMIQFLARRLTMEDKPVALRRLLSQTRSERALIAMFLALLELVRLQAILLRQDKLFSEIFIKKHVGFETVMNEGAASARDDWR